MTNSQSTTQKKTKILLYIGLGLLIPGVILNYATSLETLPVILLSLGGTFKLAYIIISLITGYYKAGWELGILLIALAIFFTGIHLKNNTSDFPYLTLIHTGIAMKIVFVVLFIRKVRQNKA